MDMKIIAVAMVTMFVLGTVAILSTLPTAAKMDNLEGEHGSEASGTGICTTNADCDSDETCEGGQCEDF